MGLSVLVERLFKVSACILGLLSLQVVLQFEMRPKTLDTPEKQLLSNVIK